MVTTQLGKSHKLNGALTILVQVNLDVSPKNIFSGLREKVQNLHLLPVALGEILVMIGG